MAQELSTIAAANLLTVKFSCISGVKTVKTSDVLQGDFDTKRVTLVKKFLTSPELNRLRANIVRFKKRLGSVAISWPGISDLYVVPDALLDRILEILSDIQNQWDADVKGFLDVYSDAIEDARQALGELFDSNDYVPVDKVKEKFNFHYFVTKITLPESKQEELKQQLLDQWSTVTDLLTDSLRASFVELFNKLKKACTQTPGQRMSPLRTKTFDDIMQFLETFDQRNLGNDLELKNIVNQLQGILSDVDRENLGNKDLRSLLGQQIDSLVADVERLSSGVRNVVWDEEVTEESEKPEDTKEENVEEVPAAKAADSDSDEELLDEEDLDEEDYAGIDDWDDDWDDDDDYKDYVDFSMAEMDEDEED